MACQFDSYSSLIGAVVDSICGTSGALQVTKDMLYGFFGSIDPDVASLLRDNFDSLCQNAYDAKVKCNTLEEHVKYNFNNNTYGTQANNSLAGIANSSYLQAYQKAFHDGMNYAVMLFNTYNIPFDFTNNSFVTSNEDYCSKYGGVMKFTYKLNFTSGSNGVYGSLIPEYIIRQPDGTLFYIDAPATERSFKSSCEFSYGFVFKDLKNCLSISSDFKKSVVELLLKNLLLLKSVSFKQDANLKQTHSKSFLEFLLNKLKDNSESFVSQLGLSESVSNAQTELELPSSANSALTLYTGGVSTFDWLTDLLNLFVDFVNSLVDYSQTSKIDRILECNFDAKKFNRLLGDALNYAMKDAGIADPNHTEEYMFPVVSRNDQKYLDLNPDGQVCLDWDGGLPSVVNHRHYNFKKVWCVGELQTDPIPYKVYIIPNWIQDVPQMVSPSGISDKI